MEKRVLVTYASKHGATAEIAHVISDVLADVGLRVDLLPMEVVSDLGGYEAVVMGSAVYLGRWLKDAVHFLTRFELSLASRPVWFFSSGPSGEGDPVELLDGWRYPIMQEALIRRIGPRDMAVFHGKLEPSELGLFERLLIKGVKAPVGDFRDWVAVNEWAQGVAAELQSELHTESFALPA